MANWLQPNIEKKTKVENVLRFLLVISFGGITSSIIHYSQWMCSAIKKTLWPVNGCLCHPPIRRENINMPPPAIRVRSFLLDNILVGPFDTNHIKFARAHYWRDARPAWLGPDALSTFTPPFQPRWCSPCRHRARHSNIILQFALGK